LRERYEANDISSRGGIDGRKNLFMQIATDSVSVLRVVNQPALLNPFSAFGKTVGVPLQDATTTSILQMAGQIGELASSSHKLSALIASLLDMCSGGSNRPTIRRLARDYNCRFAWSSIRLDNIVRNRMSWPNQIYAQSEFSSGVEEDGKGGPRALRSFWEAGGSLSWPSSLSYSPLGEPGPRRAWPPWLRFLIFVTSAGLQAGPKLWSAEFPIMLKGRKLTRRKNVTADRKRGGEDGRSSGSLLTLLDLFRGSSSPLRVRREPGRCAPAGADSKALLLRIERALYIPNTDTILSLYRGAPCPAGAISRRRRERS
jgi:hypothetical protein